MSSSNKGMQLFKIIVLIICIFLAVLSLFPFVVMIINSTRSTYQIQQHAVSLIPGTNFVKNLRFLQESHLIQQKVS